MTVDQEIKLIEYQANGGTVRDTAQAIGISKSAVHRATQKPHIREQIKSLQQRVITDLSDQAFDNIRHAINMYQTPPTIVEHTDAKGKRYVLKLIDEQLREHGYKASMEVMRAAGALPTHNTSIIIQNSFNDQRTEIPTVILDILSEVARKDLSRSNLLDDASASGGEAGGEDSDDNLSQVYDIQTPAMGKAV